MNRSCSDHGGQPFSRILFQIPLAPEGLFDIIPEIMRARQEELRFRQHGGRRKGAGRPRGSRVSHAGRPQFDRVTPAHVTLRVRAHVWNLRSGRSFRRIESCFAKARGRFGLRLIQFSVQGNHLHLIVEAEDDVALARGVQRLLSRVAMTVNALARRSGKLWRDRHHRQPLRSPSQVRNTYVYVLFNLRRHELASGAPSESTLESLDPCSSAAWFEGWSPTMPPPESVLARAGPPLVVPPHSWLARTGWRTRGLLRFDEIPR